MYVDGNTAIEIEAPESERKPNRVKTIREQKEEGIRRRQQLKAQRRTRALFYTLASAGTALVIGVMVLLLCSVIEYNTLTNEIEALTSELDTLTLQNDSIEYDIDSSVDINDIIDTATNDLGMVRSTSSQVVIYSEYDSEYIDRIAAIPTD